MIRYDTIETPPLTQHLRVCTSYYDLIDLAKSPCEMTDENRSSKKKGQKDWYGTESLDEALDLAENGYEEGLQAAKMLKDRIDAILKSETYERKYFHDVVGGSVSLPDYVLGVPDHMMNYDIALERHLGKTIEIVAEMGMNCGISTQSIELRGAALLAVIDALENQGFRVDVTITETVGNHGNLRMCYRVPLKNGDRSLSPSMISFAITHPAWLRRILFSVEEHEPIDIRNRFGFGYDTPHGGYGRPENPSPNFLEGKLFFGGDTAFKDIDQAVKWVSNILNQYKGAQ